MTLAVVYTRASAGIQAPQVTVETHISGGLPSLSIVGLPEAAVKESKDRVRSALLNSDLEFPTQRITINLAPADLPKEGGRFDLPIALGILAASGQIPMKALNDYEFAGELALSGELRPIKGALPFALGTRKSKRILVLPKKNANEASLPKDNIVLGADHILDVHAHLTKRKEMKPYAPDPHFFKTESLHDMDISEVRGQPHAKRALEIAAAGGHSLLMIGPPGTGKTMLASRLPGIMPALTNDEMLEVIAIYSLIANSQDPVQWGKRPFRAPHHTASSVALVGGGSNPRPGEVSLAHNGVLFLDELPEFDRQVLEVLREPLESGHILISRAARQALFPAKFQLIAAMNPCPCGYLGDPKGRCSCTLEQVTRYRMRISGPLLDRIDMHIEVPGLPPEVLLNHSQGGDVEIENSDIVRTRVIEAVSRQRDRGLKSNSNLNNSEIKKYCKIDESSELLLNRAIDKLGLSTRSYHRVLRVSRTIADLALEKDISSQHISEALSFRRANRGF